MTVVPFLMPPRTILKRQPGVRRVNVAQGSKYPVSGLDIVPRISNTDKPETITMVSQSMPPRTMGIPQPGVCRASATRRA